MHYIKKGVYLVVLGFVAGGLLAFNVQAEQAQSSGPAAFSDFDQDGSGQISEEEFNTLRAERMAAKAAEGKQMRGAATAPAFADVDTDGDGQINPEELAAAQKAHMAKVHGTGHGHGHGKGQGKGQGTSGARADNPCSGKNCKMPAFSDFDLDGNGVIDEAEFNKVHASKMSEMAAEGRQMKHAGDAPGFSGIDSNSDGEISEGEFAAHQTGHHKDMHGEMHKTEK